MQVTMKILLKNHFKSPKIGMRTIKTALAVVLCVMIAQALRLEYPFYAAIAAIISMGNSLTDSLKAGKNRVMGTLAGALIGLFFASIQPNNALLCGLGIILLFWVCNLLRWSASIPIAGIVFMAIMVNLKDQSPLFYSLNRILDTVIGIGIALLVNLAFYRHDHGPFLRQGQKTLAGHVSTLIIQMIENGKIGDLSTFQKSLANLHSRWLVYNNEWMVKQSTSNPIGEILQIYQDILLHFQVISRIDAPLILTPQNEDALHRRFGIHGQSILEPGDVDLPTTVFNYHIGRIIAGLNRLEKLDQQ